MDSEATCEDGDLSPTARSALVLLDQPQTSEARRYVDELAAASGNQLAAISPRTVIDHIAADVLVMHDVHEPSLALYTAATFTGCLVYVVVDVLRATGRPRTPAPRARVHR